MKKALALAAVLIVTTGCPGAVESIKSAAGGIVIKEHETPKLVCATAQFGDRVSVSCVPKTR